MSMRKTFVSLMEDLYARDERLVTILGDIGVFGFKGLASSHPDRVINIGILEQSMVSFAAGISKAGLIPVVHTIAPFLVERAYEQLKIDFGYHGLSGNFVSVGGSYDYSALGCTHHCPADVQLLKAIPGMQIVVPGTSRELRDLFNEAYDNRSPTYFRLSEVEHSEVVDISFGKASLIQEGNLGTVIAVGPTLTIAREAVRNQDYSLVYYPTIAPFDASILRSVCRSPHILVVEPFMEGTLHFDISKAMQGRPLSIQSIGVPREFLTHYGHRDQHDQKIGFTIDNIRSRLLQMNLGVDLITSRVSHYDA